jgi:hypothetical protein
VRRFTSRFGSIPLALEWRVRELNGFEFDSKTFLPDMIVLHSERRGVSQASWTGASLYCFPFLQAQVTEKHDTTERSIPCLCFSFDGMIA